MSPEEEVDPRRPGLRPDSRLTPRLIEDYLASGEWTGRPLASLLTEAVSDHRNLPAAVSIADGQVVSSLTYGELDLAAQQLGAGLRSLGLGVGDSVVVMLPNQVEFAVAIWAIMQIGAVYTGIPVSYGDREVSQILQRSGARCAIIPAAFRGTDHLAMFRALRGGHPRLERLIVVGNAIPEGDETLYQDLMVRPAPTVATLVPVDPQAVAHVGFTSGTTGEPKGVMNSHQTLFAVMHRFIEHVGADQFGAPVVNLVCSPVGHHTGFLWGVLATAYLRGTALYLDRWEPTRAAAVIEQHRATTMFGSPTFLQDLVATGGGGRDLSSLRTVVVAGAPVPRGLPLQARRAFGTWVCPAWGMTEYGIGIAARLGPDERYALTDGVAVEGCQARLVDDAGLSVGAGRTGRLQIRGAGLFLGYLNRPDATAASFEEGWFDTGDIASRDADGFVSLQGRTKDIIIRGGENIPVTEVESVIFDHPDVVEVAVVGIPDDRLGERAAAVVVLRPGGELRLAEMVAYLKANGLSTHFLPEAVVVVSALPKTPSGKIRKNELRKIHGALFTGAVPAASAHRAPS